MERHQIERRVDELRADHPGREEFIAAVQAFGQELDSEAREILGQVLLDRQPTTGGFDVLNKRLEEGGWMKRTTRRIDDQLDQLGDRLKGQ
jgi:hypothetical protein